MAGRCVTLVTTAAMFWGCASWEPVQNLSSGPPRDLGRVRLVTADSMRVTLKDAVLIDAGVVGTLWDGQSARIPVNNISSIEHREVDGFPIFFMANIVSFALLNEAVKGVNSSPRPLR